MWVRLPPPGPLNMTNWDKRFIDLADHISSWSKDRSTKVGAVIVGNNKEILSVGYNGFPRGVSDDIKERHERPLKYKWSEHAERNAIYNAARNGVRTEGASMYLQWFPCCDCARAVIQSGIRLLVCPKPELDHPRWGQNFRISKEMLQESNIEMRLISA